MKKILILLLFMGAVIGYAQGVPSPATPRPMVDSAGNLLSTTHPMPVTGSLTADIGSATINAVPSYSQASQVNVTLTPNTPYVVPAPSYREYFRVANNDGSGEFYVGIGTTTVALSTGEKRFSSYGAQLTDSVPVSIISSEAISLAVTILGN